MTRHRVIVGFDASLSGLEAFAHATYTARLAEFTTWFRPMFTDVRLRAERLWETVGRLAPAAPTRGSWSPSYRRHP